MTLSDYCSRWLFRMSISDDCPDDCSGWLFWMPISDDFSRWLFRMTIPDAYLRWLFRMTIPDDFSRWLYRMTISDNYSGCLFQMTVPDDCSGWLLRMSILGDFSRWLFRMTVRDSTTDSYFSDQFVFPRPIPISTNHSANWSHDWFVFGRRLPTAELWPRSPLILPICQWYYCNHRKVQGPSNIVISIKSTVHCLVLKGRT